MKTMRLLAGLIVAAAVFAPLGRAQEKPKPPEEAKPITPVRMQVVFTEFEGEKKISSMPYVFLVNADDRFGRPGTSVRMGLRVPVKVGPTDGAFQYMDVGANIDCSVRTLDNGRFRIDLTVERASIFPLGAEKKSLDWNPGDAPLSSQPVTRQFKTNENLLLRDGQTVQSTVATDPLTGRVVKLDVTLNVVK